MARTLCFDFGNTRLKCAVFEDEKLEDIIVLESDKSTIIQQLLDRYKPQATILSSVINHNNEIENLLSDASKFHKLSHASKLPFSTPVGKPETIGTDRLALVAAAVDIYPQNHTLAIGLGSCITYNFVNKL